MVCTVIVIKYECVSHITDLVEYLNNNLIIAYYCGFGITKKLPGYHVLNVLSRILTTHYSKS